MTIMDASANGTGARVGGIGGRWLAVVALTGLLAACSNQPSPIQGSPATGSTNRVISIGVVAATPTGLPRCISSLYGTTGLVQSPVSLYTCQAGAWLLIPCASIAAGAVAYASASKTLLACVSGQWTQVALPGGPQGPPGATGATGATGAQGAQGDAGAVSLVVQMPAPTATCPNGGTEIENGVDKNGDGQLESGEITSYSFVCNGAPGATGAEGPAGTPGPQIEVTPLPSGSLDCPAGGELVEVGVPGDGGFVVQQSATICNGSGAGGDVFAIGGVVSGLGAGDSLVLQHNGGESVTVTSDGPFSFATPQVSGTAYAVTASDTAHGGSCTVVHGSGTVGTSNVSVLVICPPLPTVLGTGPAQS